MNLVFLCDFVFSAEAPARSKLDKLYLDTVSESGYNTVVIEMRQRNIFYRVNI